jgi:hypothetical protein
MSKDSPGQVLKRRTQTLERRLEFLENKEYQNSWDKAEIAALDLLLDVLDEHRETAIRIIQEDRQEKHLQGVG